MSTEARPAVEASTRDVFSVQRVALRSSPCSPCPAPCCPSARGGTARASLREEREQKASWRIKDKLLKKSLKPEQTKSSGHEEEARGLKRLLLSASLSY